MQWVKEGKLISVKSWCGELEDKAMDQAMNLAAHSKLFKHVALMPDAHCGYGMPIGGVIACKDAVIPNAVGVDIGCGMGAVKTSLKVDDFPDMRSIRELLNEVKKDVPLGKNRHQNKQSWEGFDCYLASRKLTRETLANCGLGWLSKGSFEVAEKSLGSLGGGNHFIELQADEDGDIWLMLHSGSRNLGYKIAEYYHELALGINKANGDELPDEELAFLSTDSEEGQGYIRDMSFALEFAYENRQRMMAVFKEALQKFFPEVEFLKEVNIHHNYAGLETHFGEEVWVHRKGATSAKAGEWGIIPGSMGTSSYIVKGKGNPESFMSCSHGAGRKMSRTAACKKLTPEACDEAMEGIVFDRWRKIHGRRWQKTKGLDLGEAPQAYKDIDEVIESELDLITPVVKLRPLGVIKG